MTPTDKTTIENAANADTHKVFILHRSAHTRCPKPQWNPRTTDNENNTTPWKGTKNCQQVWHICCSLSSITNTQWFSFWTKMTVKFSLSRLWRRTAGVDVWLHSFLSLAIMAVSFKPPVALNLRDRAPGTNWKGGWLGSRARPEDMNSKISCTCQESNRCPAVIYLQHQLRFPCLLSQVIWESGTKENICTKDSE